MAKSVMTHQFSEIPKAEIPRSNFNRSHGLKTTFDVGLLTPIFMDEGLPGDTFNLKMTAFSRLATPLHPFMDNLFMNSFFFAVPIRLIWDNFLKFNGEQDNPSDSTDFLVPTITSPAGGYTELSLSDYFGIPTKVDNLTHSALWHRAYALIWNQWFRDENLQDSITVNKDDGPDDPADVVLQRRGKRHDYFTASLPFPQKGPAVGLPLGDTAPVTGIGKRDQTYDQPGPATSYETGASGPIQYDSSKIIEGGLVSDQYDIEEDPDNPGFPNIKADLASATGATINELREAFAIQKLFERDARGGTRYTEVIRSHFGVSSPDSRLQRAEYLGGGQSTININPVAQTSVGVIDGSGGGAETESTPQGNLAAFGTSIMAGHGFTKSFTEHCILLGFVSVRADLTYQQGLNRMFSRSTRFDFYWPSLSHIGEQSIPNLEIFAQGTADDDLIWGYQERHGEYRYKPSQITGQFRSNATTPLDTWHLSEQFATLPQLNSEFIEDDPPVGRVIAVPTEPHILFDSYFSLQCARPMPLYGVPGMIDRF